MEVEWRWRANGGERRRGEGLKYVGVQEKFNTKYVYVVTFSPICCFNLPQMGDIFQFIVCCKGKNVFHLYCVIYAPPPPFFFLNDWPGGVPVLQALFNSISSPFVLQTKFKQVWKEEKTRFKGIFCDFL